MYIILFVDIDYLLISEITIDKEKPSIKRALKHYLLKIGEHSSAI